jgi:hypothetical protein
MSTMSAGIPFNTGRTKKFGFKAVSFTVDDDKGVWNLQSLDVHALCE